MTQQEVTLTPASCQRAGEDVRKKPLMSQIWRSAAVCLSLHMTQGLWSEVSLKCPKPKKKSFCYKAHYFFEFRNSNKSRRRFLNQNNNT